MVAFLFLEQYYIEPLLLYFRNVTDYIKANNFVKT